MKTRAIGSCVMLGAAATLVGCGHGAYVKEGISLAQQRLAAVKAATHHEMAEQALLAGDLDKALTKVEQSTGIAPLVAKNHVLKARVMLERGSMGEALASLKVALELDEELVDTHYYLGVVYERLRKPEEALTHFRRAAELEPFDPQHAIAAGEVLMDLERYAEAQEFLEAHDASSHSPGVRQLLGHLAMFEGDTASAVERFTEARLLAPDDRTLLEDLAHAQLADGQTADAERALRSLLRDEEREHRRDLAHSLARCVLISGRPGAARSMFRDLTTGDRGRTDPDAWIGLGRAAFAVGDMRDLRRAASNTVNLAPHRPEGYMLQALWHRDRAENGAALGALEDGIRRSYEPGELHAMRALVLTELGRHREASDALARAAESGAIDAGAVRAIREAGGAQAVVGVPVP